MISELLTTLGMPVTFYDITISLYSGNYFCYFVLMADSIAFINLDFLPPSVERLFALTEASGKLGINKIFLKIINNFPWEFETRMRSEFYFPENVVAHFFKLCTDAGIRVSFVFPGPDDFGRLLRLTGYQRLSRSIDGMIFIDPDSIGFKSFLESVFEDIVSLVPNVESFILRQPEIQQASSPYWTNYNRLAAESAEVFGCKVELRDRQMPFIYSEDLFAAAELGSLPQYSAVLHDCIEELQKSVFKIRQFLIMSNLCCNGLTSDGENVFELYNNLKAQRQRFDESIDIFRIQGEGVLDRGWLRKYLSSIRIAVEEDFLNIMMRLKQLGLLNDT